MKAPTPFKDPVQFLAFGFGSGLSPKAPGTAGTLMALPLYLLLAPLPLLSYSAVLVLSAIAGIWICDRASKQLGVHDHPGIVWDEFVGLWVTMWAVPQGWSWLLAGFLLFRLFDIAKPWPIGPLDKKVEGGFGIMIDDVIAGIMACAVLHLANLVLFT
ncbi:phosphatidylglycerophosphatase A [Parahaliea sp. F7430]|uniref:Phosphatidylglycerophosphatase A n=1 Tax=Sediminihaliea albiluteola TaxID=2758564 RepID=A0A7W2TTE0_9GAMM|nr:phosphatidylglycerophosphatase A [Sediminihaliea albiluteola]MBA6411554.1 phosphatidylglycerophosphatase A [Sediminihaliea albiluteola]